MMDVDTLPPPLVRAATARLPSRYGDFSVVAFERPGTGEEFGVVVRGNLEGAEAVPVRLHSECFTGDVMGSLKCDCRDQLEAALGFIGRADRGAVVYLPQEGRGIGLANKIRAYALQDQGMDTVEANLALGFPDDMRRYDVAAEILRQLGARSVVLLTNNPSKVAGVVRAGLPVVGQIPLRATPNVHNRTYLDTKRAKSGHLL
ncbi:MAG: GTP cyclohydrolase II [Deltaproteobacteria bacterium]|nr:GTP cyclohydrolase II [Deltaproteobacteria bacterium]